MKTFNLQNKIHFYINQETNTVEILAVISTNRNPLIWKEKTDKQEK
jgi:hypothetical protein